MKTLCVAAIAVASLALCACNTTGYGYHDSIKLQGFGINMNSAAGLSAGYLGATVDRVANVDKNGKAITVGGPCDKTGNGDIFDTYANLNAKATAQANSITPAAAASAAGAAQAGVQAPVVAFAGGDTTANGLGAFIANTAATGHTADIIAALCGTPLPYAPNNTIVRDGMAPTAAGASASATTTPLVALSK